MKEISDITRRFLVAHQDKQQVVPAGGGGRRGAAGATGCGVHHRPEEVRGVWDKLRRASPWLYEAIEWGVLALAVY